MRSSFSSWSFADGEIPLTLQMSHVMEARISRGRGHGLFMEVGIVIWDENSVDSGLMDRTILAADA
ncbi:hypothetical protein N8766_01845 [bacterium]|nr:hypothetical protein [bacterium]